MSTLLTLISTAITALAMPSAEMGIACRAFGRGETVERAFQRRASGCEHTRVTLASLDDEAGKTGSPLNSTNHELLDSESDDVDPDTDLDTCVSWWGQGHGFMQPVSDRWTERAAARRDVVAQSTILRC